LVHAIERKQARSEQGVAVAEPSFDLKMATAGIGLLGAKAAAALEQGHLGRQVAALAHLHGAMGRGETHVITAAIAAGAHQPEGA
jgi:hypothetical protein